MRSWKFLLGKANENLLPHPSGGMGGAGRPGSRSPDPMSLGGGGLGLRGRNLPGSRRVEGGASLGGGPAREGRGRGWSHGGAGRRPGLGGSRQGRWLAAGEGG